MDTTTESDQPLGVPPKLLQNQQTSPIKTGRKLNWKGFFIGIIVVIIIEYFAVSTLQNDNKQPVPSPKLSPTKTLPTPSATTDSISPKQ